MDDCSADIPPIDKSMTAGASNIIIEQAESLGLGLGSRQQQVANGRVQMRGGRFFVVKSR